MEICNEVLNDYNLKVGDKIKSNVGGYVDDLEIVRVIKLKDGSIKLVVKPKIPYPNHPKPFNIDIDEAIKFHNFIILIIIRSPARFRTISRITTLSRT